jgi:carboxyl-terminal processing protease
LDSVVKTAIKENYYDGSKDAFESLKTKLSHDKKQDLLKHKDEVKHMLENEIVSRYYYTKGRIAQALQYDKELDKALALMAQQDEYNKLLKPGK